MDQTQSDRARWPKRKIFAVAGLLFAAFMTYRIFGVYTVRTGECSPGPDPIGWKTASDEAQAFPPRSPQSSRTIRVLSYNTQGHAALVRTDHVANIASVIAASKADIVGLQEVHRGTWQSRGKDQMAELAARTGMNHFYGRSFESLGGEFGNAVLTRGKIVSCNVHELPSIGEPRSLLQCEIEIDRGTLNFYVTHLAAWSSVNRTSRTAQIECITEHVRRSQLPFIIVGDFNANPESPEIRDLKASGIIQFSGNEPAPTHRVMGQHIDYILPDLGWSIPEARVLAQGVSDHWPQIADVQWSRPAAIEEN